MAKPLQQDEEGNIINDVETKKTQKAYDKYEADNAKKQSDREAKDNSTMKKIKSVMGFSKGGSASSRADGCATKGKTKGRFV